MKKLLVISFLLVYGFSSMGMSVHLHYCCGKLKDISWSPVSKDQCGKDHEMGSEACCESKEISNKEKPDQGHLQLFAKSLKAYSDVTRTHQYVQVHKLNLELHHPVDFTAPPLRSQSLHLLYCVFRI